MFLALFTIWFKKLVLIICDVPAAGKSALFAMLHMFSHIISDAKVVSKTGSTRIRKLYQVRKSLKPILLVDDARRTTNCPLKRDCSRAVLQPLK